MVTRSGKNFMQEKVFRTHYIQGDYGNSVPLTFKSAVEFTNTFLKLEASHTVIQGSEQGCVKPTVC